MTEVREYPKLSTLVTPTTTPEEFDSTVGQFLTDNDRDILGEKALDKVRTSVLYLAAFPPGPETTFDRDAIKTVVGETEDYERLTDPELDRLIEIWKSIGIVEQSEEREGRYFISDRELHKNLKALLEKYG